MKTKTLILIATTIIMVLAGCGLPAQENAAGEPTVTLCPTVEGADGAMCASDIGQLEPTEGVVLGGGEGTGPAKMPPLNQDQEAWVRVMVEDLPFSFELPSGWVRTDNSLVWIPAGVVPENGARTFGVYQGRIEAGQELEAVILPNGSTVTNRTDLVVMGYAGWQYTLQVCEGEDCQTQKEMVLAAWQADDNKVYGLYVEAPTTEEREALEPILERALESLK